MVRPSTHIVGAVAIAAALSTLAAAQCSGSTSSRDSDIASASSSDVAMGMVQDAAKADLVETAVAAGSFKTLAAALEAAGLVQTLKGTGPFTVFAPTDEAFAKLPKGTLESLLTPENKAKLVAILTYHVVPGKADASTVLSRSAWDTVNGQRLAISQAGGKAMVDGATITATDVLARNGVIHVIDTVMMPSDSNLVQTAKEAKFTTLARLIEAAGLTSTLSGDQPFTVFAPTDEAFAKLPPATLASLLQPQNKAQLVKILTFHVVPGRVYSDQALAAGNPATVEGGKLKIAETGGKVMVGTATVTKADIDARNGVIHVVDSVLMPQ